MLISESKSFLFFAFNKTASSSIEDVLRPHQSRVAYRLLQIRYQLTPAPHKPVFKHVQPDVIRHMMGPKKWQSYFKFCFVRNPFARLVSLYFYHRQIPNDRHPLASQVNFEEWILAGGSGSARRSMHDFVTDEAGNIIVDFIGQYENIERDFETICNRIDIVATLPHVNRSRHTHYATYYTERARREVERRFARDLEVFDYRFEEEAPS